MLFLHISDIHFKNVEVGQPDDPNRALRNDMLEDVKKMRAQIGRSGRRHPAVWRHRVRRQGRGIRICLRMARRRRLPGGGCRIENVFVIPGNHDVDRTAEAGPAQAMVRASSGRSPQTGSTTKSGNGCATACRPT